MNTLKVILKILQDIELTPTAKKLLLFSGSFWLVTILSYTNMNWMPIILGLNSLSIVLIVSYLKGKDDVKAES